MCSQPGSSTDNQVEEVKEETEQPQYPDYCTAELEKVMLKNARVKRFKWDKKPFTDRSNVFYMCEW